MRLGKTSQMDARLSPEIQWICRGGSGTGKRMNENRAGQRNSVKYNDDYEMAKTVVGEAVSSVLSNRKTTTARAGMQLRVRTAMPALFVLPGRTTGEQHRWTPGERLLGGNDRRIRVLGPVYVAACPVVALLILPKCARPIARKSGFEESISIGGRDGSP